MKKIIAISALIFATQLVATTNITVVKSTTLTGEDATFLSRKLGESGVFKTRNLSLVFKNNTIQLVTQNRGVMGAEAKKLIDMLGGSFRSQKGAVRILCGEAVLLPTQVSVVPEGGFSAKEAKNPLQVCTIVQK